MWPDGDGWRIAYWFYLCNCFEACSMFELGSCKQVTKLECCQMFMLGLLLLTFVQNVVRLNLRRVYLCMPEQNTLSWNALLSGLLLIASVVLVAVGSVYILESP